MKVIDNVLFNGEEIMQLRLKYMYPYVDQIYICEKRHTYQGQYKAELYIDKYREWFDAYRNKCVFLVDEEVPGSDCWETETRHRNYAAAHLPQQKSLIICADVDEIPNMETIISQKHKIYKQTYEKPLYLVQDMYYYNLNWYVERWCRSFIISDQLLTKNKDLQRFRSDTSENRQTLQKGGWHLSYFMTREEITRKIQSFAHSEFNTDIYKQDMHIDRCLQEGFDIYKRPEYTQFKKENPLHKGYPDCILAFHVHLTSR